MENERIDKRTKSYIMMRSMMNYGMGAIYLAVGAFLLFPEKLGFTMEAFDDTARYIFGGIIVLYGVWRIYRGVRKEY
ncbi:MAG: hypothetical protein JWQ96_1769 [Segetibacter sp.]|nr:hypothetical protein [Segetibacter sp.]